MWMFKWLCCLKVRKRENMTKMLLSVAKECITFFYDVNFVKRVSVPYTNLYGKLVSYLRHLQSKEAGLMYVRPCIMYELIRGTNLMEQL